ncbi:MAG: hypothetical protein ACK5ZV_07020 [bacterium]|jgi:hypothetical protein
MQNPRFEPGTRVKVVQQVPRQSGGLTTEVVGTVVRYEQSKTGSWYAHAKDDRLWLDRLVLRKADGEQVVLNLDQYTIASAV